MWKFISQLSGRSTVKAKAPKAEPRAEQPGPTAPAYLRLQAWWARTGAGIATETISDDRISGLERRYLVRLPEDFREYLSCSSPVGHATDNEVTTWWRFEDIKNIPDEFTGDVGPVIHDRGKKYLFFADYSIWCWAWAISCTEDEDRGKVALIGGGVHDRFVADSFSDFVARYVSDMRLVC